MERNENKSNFYLPRGKFLPASHWSWTDDLRRASTNWCGPWTKSCLPLESQRWKPVNGPLLSSSFDDFADSCKHPMEAVQAMVPWTTAGKCSFFMSCSLNSFPLLRRSHYFSFPATLAIKLCHSYFHLPSGSQPLPTEADSSLWSVKQFTAAASADLRRESHPRQIWEK